MLSFSPALLSKHIPSLCMTDSYRPYLGLLLQCLTTFAKASLLHSGMRSALHVLPTGQTLGASST